MNAHVEAKKLLQAYLTSALDGSGQVYGLAALTPNIYRVLLVYCCNKIQGGSFSLQIIKSIIRITPKTLQLRSTACQYLPTERGKKEYSVLWSGKKFVFCFKLSRSALVTRWTFPNFFLSRNGTGPLQCTTRNHATSHSLSSHLYFGIHTLISEEVESLTDFEALFLYFGNVRVNFKYAISSHQLLSLGHVQLKMAYIMLIKMSVIWSSRLIISMFHPLNNRTLYNLF